MKKVITILITILLALSLAACSFSGYDFVDTNYHFDRAIIEMPGGEIVEVDITQWTDSEAGEQLTITFTDREVINIGVEDNIGEGELDSGYWFITDDGILKTQRLSPARKYLHDGRLACCYTDEINGRLHCAFISVCHKTFFLSTS